ADTARALARLLHEPSPGVAHLDGNAQEGHSFLDIVLALQAAFDRPHWRVHAHDDYVHDQRLVGGPVRLAGLSETLVLPSPSRPV
ncbi:MAG: hypothetical protein ACKOD9_18785, partial [Rubrivivax sp.]